MLPRLVLDRLPPFLDGAQRRALLNIRHRALCTSGVFLGFDVVFGKNPSRLGANPRPAVKSAADPAGLASTACPFFQRFFASFVGLVFVASWRSLASFWEPCCLYFQLQNPTYFLIDFLTDVC